jgi:hypothetical protein
MSNFLSHYNSHDKAVWDRRIQQLLTEVEVTLKKKSAEEARKA